MNKRYPSMPSTQDVSDIESLRYADPGLFAAMQTVITSLKTGLMPSEAQEQLFYLMDPSVKRAIVQKASGLEASVVVTFKEQLALVDRVTRRVISPDGTANPDGKSLDISVKDAVNMSMKVVGMMTRDLPKVISLQRVQRKENALLEVIQQLDPALQQKVMLLIEAAELKAMEEE